MLLWPIHIFDATQLSSWVELSRVCVEGVNRPVARGGRGKVVPGPRDVWRPRRRSQNIKYTTMRRFKKSKIPQCFSPDEPRKMFSRALQWLSTSLGVRWPLGRWITEVCRMLQRRSGVGDFVGNVKSLCRSVDDAMRFVAGSRKKVRLLTLKNTLSHTRERQSLKICYLFNINRMQFNIIRRWTEMMHQQRVSRSMSGSFWQGCRGYWNFHGYGYGIGMGTVLNSHGFCGNSVGIFE